MKYIQKGTEPSAFSNWKALENEDWKPTYGGLSGEPKKAVIDGLKSEQGYLCCYCESTLTGTDCHIEHCRPQSDQTVDPLDWDNLLCSCLNQLRKGDPRHCGNLKENWYDANLLVSPLVSDCEQRFSYSGDGRIHATESKDLAAGETIKRLGLDIPKLNALRHQAIEPFLDPTLSKAELEQFVTGYLKRKNSRYGPYWTMIRHLFTQAEPSL